MAARQNDDDENYDDRYEIYLYNQEMQRRILRIEDIERIKKEIEFIEDIIDYQPAIYDYYIDSGAASLMSYKEFEKKLRSKYTNLQVSLHVLSGSGINKKKRKK